MQLKDSYGESYQGFYINYEEFKYKPYLIKTYLYMRFILTMRNLNY